MFLATLFIVLGVILLLNALGILVSTNFWTLFWAIVLLVVGLKMLKKKGKCPMCGWGVWHTKFHEKMCGGCCGQEHNNKDHEGHKNHETKDN